MPETTVLPTPARDAHIAACGLFCSNCRKFEKGKCAGCQVQPGFARCAIRICCQEKAITTCAECADFTAPRSYRECPKINNLIGKVFGLIFGSDRPGTLATLRDQGREAYLEAKRTSRKM
jgi:hypothetical protein